MKNYVIYHRADFDGWFSAAVCDKFLPFAETEYIGWDYNDPTPDIPKGVKLYIVDLSIPDLMDYPGLIWIDHHKSAIDKYGPRRGYQIDGVAACRLCWAWFNAENYNPVHGTLPTKQAFLDRRVTEPLALTLAGEYDVWDLSDHHAIPFQFGLTATGVEDWYGLSPLLETGGDSNTHEICIQGESAMRWQRAFASQVMRERSYLRDWEGLKFCVLGSVHTRNSMWFPENDLPKDVQALMCWRYDGKGVTFSLYHAPGHEEHDLSQIAVKYGGGGHRGACGFAMSLEDALAIVR